MACSGCPPCPEHGKECITLKGHGDRPLVHLHPPLRRGKWCRWHDPITGDRCPDHNLKFIRRNADGDVMCSYAGCGHWKKGDLVR